MLKKVFQKVNGLTALAILGIASFVAAPATELCDYNAR